MTRTCLQWGVANARLAAPTCQIIGYGSKYLHGELIRIGPCGIAALSSSHESSFTLSLGIQSMTDTKSEITQALTGLQAAATLCANTFTTSQLKVEYRVAFSAGAPLPWRLLEVHFPLPRKDKRYALRRMHCFRTAERLSRSLHERVKWRACDQELVASYLVKVQGSSNELTAGLPNARSRRQSDDLRELRPARLALRAQICITRPELVLDLLNGRVAKG
jgi:hypothetical protein